VACRGNAMERGTRATVYPCSRGQQEGGVRTPKQLLVPLACVSRLTCLITTENHCLWNPRCTPAHFCLFF